MTKSRHLTPRDEAVIAGALRAALDGPFFPDWEFHTLMGLDRDEVRTVLIEWPHPSDPQVAELAVNNALVNLGGYPHHRWDAWPEFSDASQAELEAVLSRWRGEPTSDRSGRDYFDRLAGHLPTLTEEESLSFETAEVANQPALDTHARSPRRLRWVVVAIGGFEFTDVVGAALVGLGLTYHWVTSWDDLPRALLLLSITSVLTATLILGLAVRLRGPREWAAGLVIVLLVNLLPGLLIGSLISLSVRP